MTRLLWPDLEPGDAAAGWLPEVPAVTSKQVLDAVALRHPMDGINGMPGRWVFVREVSETTGSYSADQRFDAVAIGLVPSVKYARLVYEVKVSRSDWLRELRPRRIVEWRPGVRAGSRWVNDVEVSDDELRTLGYHVDYRTKWAAALAVSTEYWVAAPPRCVLVDELPAEAGLLEVRPWGKDRELRARIVRRAPIRTTPMPDEGFWAAVLRRAAGAAR